MNDTNDPAVQAASARAAGISALRKIRKLVEAEKTQDQIKIRWARRISLLIALLVGLVLTYLWLTRF